MTKKKKQISDWRTVIHLKIKRLMNESYQLELHCAEQIIVLQQYISRSEALNDSKLMKLKRPT